MVLDIQLKPEEIRLLKPKFNSFIQSVNKLIKESNLFVEEPKIQGYFNSKRFYKETISSTTYDRPFIKIESRKYYKLSDDDDYDGWSSFNITWTEISKEKKSSGFFFFKEQIEYEYSQFTFYPTYIDDYNFNIRERSREFKTRQNYLWFKQMVEEKGEKISITQEEMNLLNQIFSKVYSIVSEVRLEGVQKEKELKVKKHNLISELDKDKNGKVDLIDETGFVKLLNKYQSKIIEIDKIYIQKFVKISGHLRMKRENLQKIFLSIKDIKNEQELKELVGLLKNQIHSYELFVFHSISMITSLKEGNLIVFYEIYECFDQLGVFNSNWENEVSKKLTDIGEGIKDLMYSINEMENRIVNSIEHLSYITQDSFIDLQSSITNELREIDSSIQVNNLLTGIQTYQMYKINQNTKRIN
jgi:hypothetical protein